MIKQTLTELMSFNGNFTGNFRNYLDSSSSLLDFMLFAL